MILENKFNDFTQRLGEGGGGGGGGVKGSNTALNLIVGILVIIVLYFVFQSIGGGGGGVGREASANFSKIFKELVSLSEKNNQLLSFQKDLVQELLNVRDNVNALNEYGIVIDQSISFEGYEGYTGTPYELDFKHKKFPSKK